MDDHLPAPERLPGMGERITLREEDGRQVTVVRRKDGTVELHHATGVLVLAGQDAGALGAFVTGHYVLAPDLARRIDHVVGGLQFDWVRVPPGAVAAGRSIDELAIRRRIGVTIVAILRGSQPVLDPDPQVRLEVGDDLVVACRAEGREALERYLRAGEV